MSSATPSPRWLRSPAGPRRPAASWPPQPAAESAPRGLPRPRQPGIVRDFKQAWEARDIDALIGLLDPGATAIADGGGLASAVARPVEGGEQIARGCVAFAGRSSPGLKILERTVNGQPGLVAQQDGVTVAVVAFDIVGDRIKHIWVVLNPEKLRLWTAD
jgi:hypothetical protein